MTQTIEKNKIIIENMIYEIKGKQVMLDTDLAILYKTETKRINEAVSRNKLKFPDRFCFKISENEYNFLKLQNATSKGGSRKGHTAFTEEGVAMLATVLKSNVATILDIIKRSKVNVIIITKANNLLTNQDILKYNKQYHNLKVIYNNTFHDRYFMLDNENIYHCGASINEIGYKTFSITLINDNFVLETLLDRVCKIINS